MEQITKMAAVQPDKYPLDENHQNIDKVTDSIDTDINPVKGTDVQEFYNGKSIFITGGTGFLGKLLIEKLLRSCPGVENIYLLVRPKRGKDIYTRIDELFDDPVFDLLKERTPKFRHKIVPVAGDCGAVGLGLALTDRLMLADKVNIIFHSAATVRFDEPLKCALATNVCGSLHVLRLARDVRNLDVMMHVSTAYSNCHLSRVEERYYPCDADFARLLAMTDKMTDAEINAALPGILGPWPNTYTFSKALTEKELRRECTGLPLGIFRPAVVTSTAKEPLRCWIDNMNGPTGIVVGVLTGVLRTLHCRADMTAELVPADLAVNCLLVAAAAVHRAHRRRPPAEPPVFNFTAAPANRITWRRFMDINCGHIAAAPVLAAVWYPTISLKDSALLNYLCGVFVHWIPALIMDALSICVGRKPKMVKVYRKIYKFSSVIGYFTTTAIEFDDAGTRRLWADTPAADRELFPFNMQDLDWNDYFSGYIGGVRRHIFKETDDSLPRAQAKYRRLYILHQVFKTILMTIGLYIIWLLCKSVGLFG